MFVDSIEVYMDSKTQTLFEARAKIIKAMAHPTRLFIVDELSRKERCVQELTNMIGSDISTVSKHLAVLKDAGIIKEEKRGSKVFHTLRTRCILNFFECVESVIKINVEAQSRLVQK